MLRALTPAPSAAGHAGRPIKHGGRSVQPMQHACALRQRTSRHEARVKPAHAEPEDSNRKAVVWDELAESLFPEGGPAGAQPQPSSAAPRPAAAEEEEEEDDFPSAVGVSAAHVEDPEDLTIEAPHLAGPYENTMPHDIVLHIGSLLSGTPGTQEASFPAHGFCLNCSVPLPKPPSNTCPACGCASPSDFAANRHLLDPTAPKEWAALLLHQQHQQQHHEQQQQQQQQQVPLPQHQKSLHPGVALCFDERMLLHRTSLPPYPERPERLIAILTRLSQQGLLPLCQLTPARHARTEELEAVHGPEHIANLKATSEAVAAAAAEAAKRAGANEAAGAPPEAPAPAPAAEAAESGASAEQGAAATAAKPAATATAAAAEAGVNDLHASAAGSAGGKETEGEGMGKSSGGGGGGGERREGVEGEEGSAVGHWPDDGWLRSGGASGSSAAGQPGAAHPSAQASVNAAIAAAGDAHAGGATTPSWARAPYDFLKTESDPAPAQASINAAIAAAGDAHAAAGGGRVGGGDGGNGGEAQASSTTSTRTSSNNQQQGGSRNEQQEASSSQQQEESRNEQQEASTDLQAASTDQQSASSSEQQAVSTDQQEGSTSSGEQQAVSTDQQGSSSSSDQQQVPDANQQAASSEQQAPSTDQQAASSSSSEQQAASTGQQTQTSSSSSSNEQEASKSEHRVSCGGTLAPDSLVNAHTFEAASLAAGASAEMARAVVQGEVGCAFGLVRPHGHHARYELAQSGCYFNNAAVAARAAQAAGAQRVLVVDWDTHAAQGTQELFLDDDTVLVASLHRHDEEFYPLGFGAVTDMGEDDGRGFSLNIPWQDNMVTDADYLQCMMHVVLPVAYEFEPDVVIVSAGFDGASGDFMGQCSISAECYAHMTHMLMGLAPCVFLLEGGYNLDATARCVEACLRVLLGERPPKLDAAFGGTQAMTSTGTTACMNAMQVQGDVWSSLNSLNLNGWMAAIREYQKALSEEDSDYSETDSDSEAEVREVEGEVE